MKRLLFGFCMLTWILLPRQLEASIWGYTWIQWDEYAEEIDVYGATGITGSYQEQFYYEFAADAVLYANGNEVDWDYYGWSVEGAWPSVSAVGQPGSVYELVGTYDVRVYFNDVCYPWWYDLAGYHWYVYNPLFAPGEATWETFDPTYAWMT